MSPLVELKDLTRSFYGWIAVEGLTVSMEGGEIFGLLGADGAGKSTTLKMLATLLRPNWGKARVGGFDVVSEANEVRKVVGYVPEGADLYEVLTGQEFLDVVRDLHGIPPADAAARRDPLVDAFAMGGDLGRAIGKVSRGAKQKLLLIASLQHDSRVLLLDEPMEGLDASAQERLKDVLRERAASGGCVVYASRSLEVAEQICDRVAILHRGRLAALGSPRELVAESGESLSRLFLRLTTEIAAS